MGANQEFMLVLNSINYSGSLLAALERKSLLYTIFISKQAVSVLILLTMLHGGGLP